MTNQIVMQTSLTLYDVEGEPRIKDTELGQRLGYARPAKIRELIKAHEENLNKINRLPTVGCRPEGGGREVMEYYLDRKQAIFICMKSETANAIDVQMDIVHVYDKHLSGGAPSAPLTLHQQANADIQAWKDSAALFGAPIHIALQEGTKDVLDRLGVDFTPLLLASSFCDDVQVEDVYLEPTELGERLGYGVGKAAAMAINRALAVIGWQIKVPGGWEPTDVGRAFCQRHAWTSGRKSGYNWKWSYAAVLGELTDEVMQ